MTVFKGYLKIMKQNMPIILLYMGVFFAITLMIQASTRQSMGGVYQAESVKIGFVDEDGGSLAQGFQEYLEKYHEVIPMENDKKKLQENLFYQNIQYIVKVPDGFEEKCLMQDEKLSVTKIPGSYTSFYVDQQINSFLNSAKTYYAAGYTVEETVKAVNEKEKPKVTMLDESGNAGVIPGYNYYYRFIPYMMINILCYVLGNILSAFHKTDIRKRMQASAVSVQRQNLEALLAAFLFGIILFGISIAGGFVLYGEELMSSEGILYYMLNAFIMMVVALAMSYLVGMLTNSINALNGIVNTLSLGMGFMCGVFVPMEVMGKGVKTVAQFLPVYWYEKINVMLSEFGTVTGSIRVEIFQAFGIQLVFAVAILCVAMVVGKRQRFGMQ